MRAAWEWVKKYWELLAGALVLLFGVLLGVSVQRRRAPLQEPNPVEDEANEEAKAEAREAENEAADEKAEAVKQHDDDLAVLAEKLQDTTAEVRTDSDKTNTYLRDVGKAVRGEDP